MKKIIVILSVMFMLCGCSDGYRLKKLGYSEEDIEKIEQYSEETIELFIKSFDERLIVLINTADFDEELIDEYLQYYDCFDIEDLVYLVNYNIVNESNIKDIQSFMKDDYYIVSRTADYLEYKSRYMNLRTLIEAVNSNCCFGQYSRSYQTDTSKGNLMLLNKFYSLDASYEPEDLVEVDNKYTKYNVKLKKECYEAYQRMYEDGIKDGMDLSINSAYRNYQLQYDTYNRFLLSDPEDVVDTYSARPGHSEHQTGLAIDIISEGSTFGNFHLTKEAEWLRNNCDKYGFIIRYPEDKTDVTLYKYEAWHVRYVGDEATKIKESGLTFDEYYAYYVENR